MKVKVILTAVAFVASLGIVSAQTAQTQTTKSESRKSCYVDANNNKVCDKYENKTCTKGNGNGLRDGSGKRYGSGRGNGNCQGRGAGKKANYVDSNNNGICDNRENVKK